MKQNYVSSFKDTVMLRDIVSRYNVKDVKLLDDLFVYLVNTASNLISITNIINYFASKKLKTNTKRSHHTLVIWKVRFSFIVPSDKT